MHVNVHIMCSDYRNKTLVVLIFRGARRYKDIYVQELKLG